jgi:hypothetical protein
MDKSGEGWQTIEKKTSDFKNGNPQQFKQT